MTDSFAACLDRVRAQKPLVHCITNYVTANDVANMLYACGGAPIMADAPEEAADITAKSAALVINTGTPSRDRFHAMLLAGKQAAALSHPIVLDPVGAGGSPWRTQNTQRLLHEIPFSVIRGNFSEIRALDGLASHTRGVDASPADEVNENTIDRSCRLATEMARNLHAVICLSGPIDLVADKSRCYVIRNGCSEMSAVTGTGCMLSGIIAAYVAANPDDPFTASAAAVSLMGLSGERAKQQIRPEAGNASFRTALIDAVCRMRGTELAAGSDAELHTIHN